MLKLYFKILGLIFLIGYLLVAGVLYGSWRDEPKYRGVKIDITYPNDDAHFVTEPSIMKLVESKPGFKYKGCTYQEVNTMELAQYIEDNNRLVRHATCYHTPDSLLRIDVEQRNPVIRVKSELPVRDEKGLPLKDFYIDDDCKLMPVQLGTAIRLPLVTGFVSPEHLEPLRDFAMYLKDDDFWDGQITQINLRQNGDVQLVPRVGEHTILLGSFDNYQTKLQNVRTFYEKVLPRKGWNAYRTINVKFDGQVVGEKY